jgi:hypothetical protein
VSGRWRPVLCGLAHREKVDNEPRQEHSDRSEQEGEEELEVAHHSLSFVRRASARRP